jgi:hypothetical protein
MGKRTINFGGTQATIDDDARGEDGMAPVYAKQGMVSSLFSGKQEPIGFSPEGGKISYPSEADLAFALKHGQFYGTAAEPYANGQMQMLTAKDAALSKNPKTASSAASAFMTPGIGKDAPVPSEVGKNPTPDDLVRMQMMGRALLAANRDEFASQGADPTKFGVSTRAETTLGGAYFPEADKGFATRSLDNKDQTGSSLLHEMTHRGIAQNPGSIRHAKEEDFVRLTNQKLGVDRSHLGDGYKIPKSYTFDAYHPEKSQALEAEARKAIADKIAKQRPMGPR